MESEIAEVPAVFERLISHIDNYSRIAELIKAKEIKSVLVLARGTSDNAAHFLKYLIEVQLGLPVGLTSPSSVTIYKTKLHFQNTLVVALSQSGQSTDLVEYANSAKSAGALLISMTNDEASPLATLADFHLPLMAGTEIAVAATKSYAAQLLSSLLLVSAWSGKKFDLDTLIVQTKLALENTDLVMQGVALCDSNYEIVVLGRGFSYPNARECALKIQETSKISVQGLSIADYMHGPISALTKDTRVIVIAPNGFPMDSLKTDIEKIRNSSPKLIWIGSSQLAGPQDVVISGANCGSEVLASIVDVIALQMLALHFARKNGLDPDSPAGLSKVTHTI